MSEINEKFMKFTSIQQTINRKSLSPTLSRNVSRNKKWELEGTELIYFYFTQQNLWIYGN